MKTHINIDNALLTQAMKLGQWNSKRKTVNEALAVYVRHLKRQEMLALRGKVPWEGDLDNLRVRRGDAAV